MFGLGITAQCVGCLGQDLGLLAACRTNFIKCGLLSCITCGWYALAWQHTQHMHAEWLAATGCGPACLSYGLHPITACCAGCDWDECGSCAYLVHTTQGCGCREELSMCQTSLGCGSGVGWVQLGYWLATGGIHIVMRPLPEASHNTDASACLATVHRRRCQPLITAGWCAALG